MVSLRKTESSTDKEDDTCDFFVVVIVVAKYMKQPMQR